MQYRVVTAFIAALALTVVAHAAESIRILPIGDSITQGGRVGVKEYTYRLPLYRMLRDEGTPFEYIGSRVHGLDKDARWTDNWSAPHEGYYGATTVQVLANIRGNLPKLPPPDVALIHLGTNDRGDVEIGTIAPLREMVGALRARNAGVKVLIAEIPSSGLRGMFLHWKIRSLAADLDRPSSRVISVNMFDNWTSDAASRRSDTFDGVHPNLRGQRYQAERWLDAIHETASSPSHP